MPGSGGLPRGGEWRPSSLAPGLRCEDGSWFLVEIKQERAREDPVEGEDGLKARAVRSIVEQNPGRLGDQMVFTPSDDVLAADVVAAQAFADACGRPQDRVLS